MAEKDNSITNVKLEINGEWYDMAQVEIGSTCKTCALFEICEAESLLSRVCTELGARINFKKVDKKSLEDARFFHG